MKKVVCLFLLFLIIPIYTKAEEIDINSRGSIKINYKYADKIIYGSHISIYKIASSNNRGEFTYLNQYDLDDDLKMDTASGWNDLAVKIEDYVKKNSIESLSNCDITEGKECKFDNLDVGLYLIVSSDIKVGDYQYSASPTLIAVPTYNEVNTVLNYDIDVFLKVGAKAVHVENNTTNVPKTIDDIYTYFIIGIVSIIVMVVVVLYINKLKKKEKNNEKDN